MENKFKFGISKVIATTFGVAHFVAQSSADLLVKSEANIISKIYDCKDSRVDIILSRKHSTRDTQNKIKATVKDGVESFDVLKKMADERMSKMYNYKKQTA